MRKLLKLRSRITSLACNRGAQKVFRFVCIRGVLVIVWLIGLVFVVTLLADLRQDSTKITNSLFAILASLSALSFSAARSVGERDEARDRFAFAGERFLHGAILLIVASVIKYASFTVGAALRPHINSEALLILAYIFGFPVPVLFVFGLSFSSAGLGILSDLLWTRLNRHRDWDDLV